MQLALKHIGSHSDRSDGLANKQDFDRLKVDRNKKLCFFSYKEEKKLDISITNNGDPKAKYFYHYNIHQFNIQYKNTPYIQQPTPNTHQLKK